MKRLSIIGCGNMGEAILKGIVSKGIVSAKNISVSDTDSSKLQRIKKVYGVDVSFTNSAITKSADTIIVAVKPQDISAVLADISGCLDEGKLLISVAAGITIKRINSLVGKDVPVVRVMPNMPALVNMGFSCITFSKKVSEDSSIAAKNIFGSIGEVEEVKEKDLDALTAISGSGPAYFFYFTELLMKCGIDLGLSSKTAKNAAMKTAIGSAQLLKALGQDPQALRKKVTSKGGTTEAAFNVFRKKRLGEIFASGVKAAKKRSKELSGG